MWFIVLPALVVVSKSVVTSVAWEEAYYVFFQVPIR